MVGVLAICGKPKSGTKTYEESALLTIKQALDQCGLLISVVGRFCIPIDIAGGNSSDPQARKVLTHSKA